MKTHNIPLKRNATLDPHRLNYICPYYTMFPLSFPLHRLKRACPGDKVLDPFCGRGTTNYAAALHGLFSVGIDSNPVAEAVAAAKVTTASPSKIVRLCKDILSTRGPAPQVPNGAFWALAYHEKTLDQICKLRGYFLKKRHTRLSAEERALKAIILGALHGPMAKKQPSYLSNQMPRTYATKPNSAINFWKKRNMAPPMVDVALVIERRAKYYFGRDTVAGTRGRIILADSRTIAPSSLHHTFRWVITSPPYFGMRTYISDQWLRYWFTGGSESVRYSTDELLASADRETFAADLGKVWRLAFKCTTDDAIMIVRLGQLPSMKTDVRGIFQDSLESSGMPWRTARVDSAGTSALGRRQASQFVVTDGALEEYDFTVVKYAC